MARILVRAHSSFLHATRGQARPVSLNGNRYIRIPRSTQQSFRTYKYHNVLPQGKDATQEMRAEGVSEENTRDITAAGSESATVSREDEALPIRRTDSFREAWRSPKIDRSEFAIHKSDPSRFEVWMADIHTKAKDSIGSQLHHFSLVEGINLSATVFPGMEKVGICLEFENSKYANALDKQLIKRLTNAFVQIRQHPRIGVIFLTSQSLTAPGKSFCAGVKLQELMDLGDRSEAESFIRGVSRLCTAIRNTPVPVVALISGACVGAGLEMAASCDMRVAVSNARFSMPEVRLGIPSVVQARLLCDIVGWGRARHLMLTGESWTAQEGYEAGLVTKLFDDNNKMRRWVFQYTKQIISGSNDVYIAQKQLMRKWEDQSIAEGIEAGVECFANTFSRAENIEEIRTTIQTTLKRIYKKQQAKEESDDEDLAGGDEK